MTLLLERFKFGDTYTIGRLYMDGIYECYTLEDKVRDEKIHSMTAIPTGTYKVIVDFSNRFQKEMPHILNVPNFEGIRIHSGNTNFDTNGCILLGLTWREGDFIGNSRAAYNHFFDKLKMALDKEQVTITIK